MSGAGEAASSSRVRVAVDIGGTFTDFVVLSGETGDFIVGKALSDPQDLTAAVVRGLHRLGVDPTEIEFFVHGTTVGLNALLEGKGEPVALVTTKGFRDVLEIGRMSKPDMYNIFYSRPAPLVPRRHRFEVDERVDGFGSVLRRTSLGEVNEIAAAIDRVGIRSVAVCTLNSFVNPESELEVAALLRQVLDDAYLSVSHEVVNEWREFERTSTTVLNAYVLPVVQSYLRVIGSKLGDLGLQPEVHIMQSSGGIMTSSTAQVRPIHTLLSGPVGGAVGGRAIAALAEDGPLAGTQNVVTADVGGTSFDASLIIGGDIDLAIDGSVSGYPLLVPSIRVTAIGAGGGSIARVEGARSLRVGPESAGARPGPVCYATGGVEATVTDANLVLGRLDPAGILGGEVAIDAEGARRAVTDQIGAPLGLEVEEAAEGILQVINSKMALAIRELTVAQGLDPKEFVMVAFGGAGPMHAVDICREIGIPYAIIPPIPGMFSAWGMLTADLRHDAARTFLQRVELLKLGAVGEVFATIEVEAKAALEAQGVRDADISYSRALDMRYVGQEHTLSVTVEADVDPRQLKALFDRAHERKYGHASDDDAVEVVTFRVTGTGTVPKPAMRRLDRRAERVEPKARRQVYFDGAFRDTPIYDRSALGPGVGVEGPAIVDEDGATTVLPPGAHLAVDTYGNLVLVVAGEAAEEAA